MRARKTGSKSVGRKVADRDQALLPLHHNVYLILRQRLVHGQYRAGEPLPGEHQISSELQVARSTVRKALGRLTDEGLVTRRMGAGTFAADARPVSTPRAKTLSYFEQLRSVMGKYTSRLVSFEHVPTPFVTDPIDRFGPVALKIVRLSFLNRRVVHLLSSCIPADLGQRLSPSNLKNRAIQDILAGRGTPPERFHLSIGAIIAHGDEAKLLEVSFGTPLLQGVRRSYDASGRLIEFNETVSRTDRFRYGFLTELPSSIARASHEVLDDR